MIKARGGGGEGGGYFRVAALHTAASYVVLQTMPQVAASKITCLVYCSNQRTATKTDP